MRRGNTRDTSKFLLWMGMAILMNVGFVPWKRMTWDFTRLWMNVRWKIKRVLFEMNATGRNLFPPFYHASVRVSENTGLVVSVLRTCKISDAFNCVVREWQPVLQLNEKFTIWCPRDQERDLVCACTSENCCIFLCFEDEYAWVCPMHTHLIQTMHWCRQEMRLGVCRRSCHQIRGKKLFEIHLGFGYDASVGRQRTMPFGCIRGCGSCRWQYWCLDAREWKLTVRNDVYLYYIETFEAAQVSDDILRKCRQKWDYETFYLIDPFLENE